MTDEKRGKATNLIHIDQPTNWQSIDLGAVISGWLATSDSLDVAKVSVDGLPAQFHRIDRPDARAAHPNLMVTGFLLFYNPVRKTQRLTIELGDARRSEKMTMSSIAEQELAELFAPALRQPKGTFFRIRTGATSRLSVDVTSGYISNIDDACEDARFADLFAYVTSERESIAFLLAPSFVRVLPDLVGHRILPMGMCRTSPPHTVSLYDLQRRLWLCVVPHLTGAANGVVVDREVIAEWERLTFEEMSENSTLPIYQLTARRIDELLGQPLNGDAIVGLGEKDAATLGAVGLVSRETEWQNLAQEALENSKVINALTKVFPEDFYLVSGLWKLFSAQNRSQPPGALSDPKGTLPRTRERLVRLLGKTGWGKTKVDRPSQTGLTRPSDRSLPKLTTRTSGFEPEVLPRVSADDLSRDSRLKLRHDNEYTYHSFTFALNAVARQLVRPRKRFCVLATARNEGPYLLEWIAYYLHLGMDTILLYTNNNTDGSDDLLAALHSAGVICWVRNEVEEGTVAQHKAYAHAFAASPVTIDHEWVLTVDLDEFLVIDRRYFPTLDEWVLWLERRPIDAIAINWRFCGPNGQRKWSDEFIMRRFSDEDQHVDQTIKTMCRPHKVISSNEHFPVAYYRRPLLFVNDSGAVHVGREGHLAFSTTPSGRYAWINHYWYKSAQEFLWKWSRNRGNEPLKARDINTFIPQFALEHFTHNFGRESPPSAEVLGIETAVSGVRQTLLKLPGVAEANAAIRSRFTQQIAEVQDRLLSSSSILDGGEYGEAFLRIMGAR